MAWKVTICGVEQDGVFTSEECGDKIGALLFMMHGGKIDVRFEGVEDKEESTRKSKVNKTRQEFMGEVETAVQKIVKSSAWCQVQVSYDGSGVRVCCSDLLNRGEVISELRARGFDAKEGDDYYAIDVSDADAEDLKASTRKSFSSMVKSQRAKARRD